MSRSFNILVLTNTEFIYWLNKYDLCVHVFDLSRFKKFCNNEFDAFFIYHFPFLHLFKGHFKGQKITIVFNKWCLNKDINEDCFITKFNMRSNKITITVYCKKNIRNLTFRRNSKTYSVDNMFEWYYARFYSRSIVKQEHSKQLHVV